MAVVAKKTLSDSLTKEKKDSAKGAKTVVKKAKSTVKSNEMESHDAILRNVTEGSEVGKVFNLPENKSLVGQFARVYYFNQRVSLAKTKTRGEVAGSGRKPWKQKHTGRARVGSIRNPVWRHGGVAHGPTRRDWSLRFPKKMKHMAFMAVLSQRIRSGDVYETTDLTVKEGRTEEVLRMLNSWGILGSTLLVMDEVKNNLARACANLKNVEIASATNLNAFQLMKSKNIVFEKSALEKIKDKYVKNK